jgi:ribonuclease H / adenosylcobalamin/alpha-ribazole phosphatase
LTVRQPLTRLYLIRHCSTLESARGRCIGRTDVPLSAAGIDCAKRLGRSLEPAGLSAIYSSPLQRARATAAPIAAAADREVVIAGGLMEVDFGSLEGRTFDEIAATDPGLHERWMTSPTQVAFPGGESYADLKARAVAALNVIINRNRGAAIAVVSHGGPIRAFLADLLEMPDDAAFRLEIDHGGVAEVDWIGDRPILSCLNGFVDRVLS